MIGLVSAAGLSASPTHLKIDLKPLFNYNGMIHVTNTGNDPLTVQITGKREQSNEVQKIYSDTGVARWIHVNSTEFTLNPMETRDMPLQIITPRMFDLHDARGVLIVTGTQNTPNPCQGMHVNQGLELVIPITLGLPGPIIESIQFSQLQIPSIIIGGLPHKFTYNLSNNGTVKEDIITSNSIKTSYGQETSPVTNTTSLYPGDTQKITNSLNPDWTMIGLCIVKTELKYGLNETKTSHEYTNKVFILPWWTTLLITGVILVILRKRFIGRGKS